EVFASGEALRDQLELIRRADGSLGWYLTTKIPVADRSDPSMLVGLVSVSRDLLAPSSDNIEHESLQSVVGYVRERLTETIRVGDLATAAECSEGQLERRMRRVFGLSATQYVLRVRVETATKLLIETDRSLADIANLAGFYDQSDFTRRFARLTNQTPAQFRASHRS
ncbi:MAG: AraC family transcriptional regulator, partial [Acidimicrobiales bacterium]